MLLWRSTEHAVQVVPEWITTSKNPFLGDARSSYLIPLDSSDELHFFSNSARMTLLDQSILFTELHHIIQVNRSRINALGNQRGGYFPSTTT